MSVAWVEARQYTSVYFSITWWWNLVQDESDGSAVRPLLSVSLDQSGQFVKLVNAWLKILLQRREQYYYCWQTLRIHQETPSAVSLRSVLELPWTVQSFRQACRLAAVRSSVVSTDVSSGCHQNLSCLGPIARSRSTGWSGHPWTGQLWTILVNRRELCPFISRVQVGIS